MCNQHGFRKRRRSCETQLIVDSRPAKGKQVDVILLDFEKAFDNVSHGRLLYMLDHYGVRDSTCTNRWIRYFPGDGNRQCY